MVIAAVGGPPGALASAIMRRWYSATTSLGFPARAISPACSSTAVSHSRSIAVRSCEMNRLVIPCLLSSWIRCRHFGLEFGVANGEHFVDQQDLGLQLRRDGEAEAYSTFQTSTT